MKISVNKIYLLIIIFLSLIIVSLIFVNHKFSAEETILDEVKLKEKLTDNDSLAIMLEQNDGTYKESNANTFPDYMTFNSELSGCIDEAGNKLDGALDFDKDNNLVYVTTSSTTYCYLYFDYMSISSYLIGNVSEDELWNSTLEDDGYRYVGTNPDNYICFGTNDKNECITDKDKYMYRIIGIFEDENHNYHLKLIKKEALNEMYAWHSENVDVDFNESDLYKGLNGDYFLTNSEYSYMQNDNWLNKISTWNYTMTNSMLYTAKYGPSYVNSYIKSVYLHELNRSSKNNEGCYTYDDTASELYCDNGIWTTLSSKISLIYVSDFSLSLGGKYLNYQSYKINEILKNSWLHISK